MTKTLRELADHLGGTLVGNGDVVISGVGSLDHAAKGEITFLANPRYSDKVATTGAGAVIIPPDTDPCGRDAIVVANPYLAFARVLSLFHGAERPFLGVMAGAFIGQGVVMGPEVTIFPGACVADGVRLGNRVTLHPGVVLYEGVEVGDDVTLHANVSVRERCRIGSRVTVHNGTVIGSDGFGYAPDASGHQKIPQVGIVVIEDDVEIGANTTIDRAALEVTRIGRGTKIDNLVQIAHNCEIGEHCLIISQAGLAGSARLGNRVTIAGQVGVGGHLEIADGVTVVGKSGVVGSITEPGVYSGIPVIPHKEWRKLVATLPRLPEMRRTVAALEKRLAELETRLGNAGA